MDIGTVLGFILGFGLVIGSILIGGSLTAFMDAPSALVVVGGTIAATLVSQTMQAVKGTVKVGMKAVFAKPPVPKETIEAITELATAARKDGILALEKMEVQDQFLGKGIRLAVDGIAPEEITGTLGAELSAMKARHKGGQEVFRFMAGTAPSMGMIGTLVGLVQMLQALDDPSSIGPAMAVALLTTLYGAVVAFQICNPLADKLDRRSTQEANNMKIIIEGVEGILKGENPKLIKEKLESLLPPAERTEQAKE